MNKEQILREIREANFNSLELNQLAEEVKTQETRKLTFESIKKKKEELEKLEQRVRDIDNGNYKEEIDMEDNENYLNR